MMKVKSELVNTETPCICTFSIMKIYGWILCRFDIISILSRNMRGLKYCKADFTLSVTNR